MGVVSSILHPSHTTTSCTNIDHRPCHQSTISLLQASGSSATPEFPSILYNLTIYYRVHNSPHSQSFILIIYFHIFSGLLPRTATSHHVATASPRVVAKPIFFQLPNVPQHREEVFKLKNSKRKSSRATEAKKKPVIAG